MPQLRAAPIVVKSVFILDIAVSFAWVSWLQRLEVVHYWRKGEQAVGSRHERALLGP
jgi:hypothetical protein